MTITKERPTEIVLCALFFCSRTALTIQSINGRKHIGQVEQLISSNKRINICVAVSALSATIIKFDLKFMKKCNRLRLEEAMQCSVKAQISHRVILV